MINSEPIDLPYYLELEYPLQEAISLHQAECRLWRRPFQVLWVESRPCLVCTWEHFSARLSATAMDSLEERIRSYMKNHQGSLRLARPHAEKPVTVSFSDCRGQCTFINLPDLRTGRTLAKQTGEFLTQLLASLIQEDAEERARECAVRHMPAEIMLNMAPGFPPPERPA